MSPHSHEVMSWDYGGSTDVVICIDPDEKVV